MPETGQFYRSLDITDADLKKCMQKIFVKDFEIKSLGEYYDLYLKNDTLLLADISEYFRKMCLEIYQLDPVKFLSVLGLAWEAVFQENKEELELLTEINMLFMIGTCCKSYQ